MQAANFEARAEIMTSIPDAYTHLAAVQLGFGVLFLRLVEFMKTKLKEYMAHRLLKLEPDNSAYHTLLSNLKESVGQWGEVEEGK
ncbi:hypothetical protein CFP56_039319 [Quercus suber]